MWLGQISLGPHQAIYLNICSFLAIKSTKLSAFGRFFFFWLLLQQFNFAAYILRIVFNCCLYTSGGSHPFITAIQLRCMFVESNNRIINLIQTQITYRAAQYRILALFDCAGLSFAIFFPSFPSCSLACVFLGLSSFISLCLSLPLQRSLFLSFYLSVSLFLSLSFYLSFSLFLSLSLYLLPFAVSPGRLVLCLSSSHPLLPFPARLSTCLAFPISPCIAFWIPSLLIIGSMIFTIKVSLGIKKRLIKKKTPGEKKVSRASNKDIKQVKTNNVSYVV